jgi:hypothetical protein
MQGFIYRDPRRASHIDESTIYRALSLPVEPYKSFNTCWTKSRDAMELGVI